LLPPWEQDGVPDLPLATLGEMMTEVAFEGVG
jgi:hypothetical protein